jgi:hypothetical protein
MNTQQQQELQQMVAARFNEAKALPRGAWRDGSETCAASKVFQLADVLKDDQETVALIYQPLIKHYGFLRIIHEQARSGEMTVPKKALELYLATHPWLHLAINIFGWRFK